MPHHDEPHIKLGVTEFRRFGPEWQWRDGIRWIPVSRCQGGSRWLPDALDEIVRLCSNPRAAGERLGWQENSDLKERIAALEGLNQDLGEALKKCDADTMRLELLEAGRKVDQLTKENQQRSIENAGLGALRLDLAHANKELQDQVVRLREENQALEEERDLAKASAERDGAHLKQLASILGLPGTYQAIAGLASRIEGMVKVQADDDKRWKAIREAVERHERAGGPKFKVVTWTDAAVQILDWSAKCLAQKGIVVDESTCVSAEIRAGLASEGIRVVDGTGPSGRAEASPCEIAERAALEAYTTNDRPGVPYAQMWAKAIAAGIQAYHDAQVEGSGG